MVDALRVAGGDGRSPPRSLRPGWRVRFQPGRSASWPGSPPTCRARPHPRTSWWPGSTAASHTGGTLAGACAHRASHARAPGHPRLHRCGDHLARPAHRRGHGARQAVHCQLAGHRDRHRRPHLYLLEAHAPLQGRRCRFPSPHRVRCCTQRSSSSGRDVSLDSRGANPVEAEPSGERRLQPRPGQMPGGYSAGHKKTQPAQGAVSPGPPRNYRVAAAARLRAPDTVCGRRTHSRRSVEVRRSALVSHAEGAPARAQGTLRESKLERQGPERSRPRSSRPNRRGVVRVLRCWPSRAGDVAGADLRGSCAACTNGPVPTVMLAVTRAVRRGRR